MRVEPQNNGKVSRMKTIGLEQSHELMAKLATNVDWSQIPTELAQAIIRDPVGAGREFTAFLKNQGRCVSLCVDGIMVPSGARIHWMSVMVDESLQWHTAVAQAGPNTAGWENIWSVGAQFPSVPDAVPAMRDVLLVNFQRRIHTDEILAWAREHKLVPITPRTCFVIGKEYFELYLNLAGGSDYMCVLSLIPSVLNDMTWTPVEWWNKVRRGAGMQSFNRVWDAEGNWFGFTPASPVSA